jgi:hypothetical protein
MGIIKAVFCPLTVLFAMPCLAGIRVQEARRENQGGRGFCTGQALGVQEQ